MQYKYINEDARKSVRSNKSYYDSEMDWQIRYLIDTLSLLSKINSSRKSSECDFFDDEISFIKQITADIDQLNSNLRSYLDNYFKNKITSMEDGCE